MTAAMFWASVFVIAVAFMAGYVTCQNRKSRPGYDIDEVLK